MRVPDRGVRVDGGIAPPVRKPCKLPGLARPGFHRKPRPANGGDPAPVRRTGALFAARPFPGSRRMTAMPRARGRAINREHARRRTRRTGIAAPGPEPRTAKPAPGHKIFPDLPRRLAAGRIRRGRPASPMFRSGAGSPPSRRPSIGRAGRGWRLPNTRDVPFRVPALEEALARRGKPEIFDTGQGSRFTGAAFAGTLAAGIRVPMDGRGRRKDNVFIARRHHGRARRESRGQDAAPGQRRRVARMPAAAAAAESSLID